MRHRKGIVKQILSVILVMVIIFTSLPIQVNAAAKGKLATMYKGLGFDVTFNVTSNWNGEFNANVTIANTSDQVIDNWALEFTMPYEIVNIWNGVVKSKENGKYVIKNAGYNQDIGVRQSISFGFTVKYDGNIIIPDLFSLLAFEEMVASKNFEVNFKVTSDWKSGFNGEIKITNISKQTIEDWKLEFDFGHQITMFWAAEIMKHDGSHYYIKNAGHNANIKPGESVVLGFSGNPGSISKNPENYKLSQIVTTPNSKPTPTPSLTPTPDMDLDTDGDGLTDYIETMIGTNIEMPDTDGDGLTDGQEYYLFGLNPLKVDSDDNGINDGDEDFDLDGLTILEEIKLGTNPLMQDTDLDGLTDGDEVFIYHTNPLLIDTDGDGISDGDEVALGLDPLSKDSDGNGILDNEEKIEQTLVVDITEEEKPEIKSVSLTMMGTGNIQSNTTIKNVYNIDTLSSGVVGLIGVPIEITSDSKFDEATITFNYDDSMLGNTEEENLRVMWYDEENDFYEILEDSIVDLENNTISYKTTHFSTYLVVDSEEWYNVWEKSVIYHPNPKENKGIAQFYDIVYLADCTSSMKEEMDTIKMCTKDFINVMDSNDRAGLVTYGSDKVSSYNILYSKDTIIKTMDNMKATGYGSAEKGLNKAIDLLLSSTNSTTRNKMIILFTDGDIDITNSTIQRAKSSNIKIFPVLFKSVYNKKRLEEIANLTNGILYLPNTSSAVKKALLGETIDFIGFANLTDTDGDKLPDIYETLGMIISNGKTMYSDPTKIHSDGDGLTDAEEMGYAGKQLSTKKMKITIEGVTKEINVNYFAHCKSNPQMTDTDMDGYDDAIDAYPFDFITEKTYIFYEDGKDADWFLSAEAYTRSLDLTFRGIKVELIPLHMTSDFQREWNAMGLDKNGKVEFAISDVYTIFHGSPRAITIGKDYNNPTPNNAEILYNNALKNFNDKKIGILHLSSCNNGNLDWLNILSSGGTNFSQNMAISFMKQCPSINVVKAWDGSAVYVYVGEYSVGGDSFSKWSKDKNGWDRLSSGLITYTRKANGGIDYDTKYLKKIGDWVTVHGSSYREIIGVTINEVIK